MTKRAVVAIASVKKRDTMISRNVVDGGSVGSFGSTLNGILWCSTSRPMAGRNVNSPAARSSSRCWMKGLSERINFESNTSDPWEWRRILFTIKGPFPETALPQTQYTYFETDISSVEPNTVPGGITNPVNMPGNIRTSRSVSSLTNTQLLFVTAGLFMGTRGIDYIDPFLGVPDRSAYQILSDKVVRMRSGNDSPLLKTYKLYHPMNQTLQYADGESGGLVDAGGFSTNSRYTMGDVYVLDLFKQLNAAPASMTMTTTSTLYWHER